jgi:Domain of unknown function DUF29
MGQGGRDKDSRRPSHKAGIGPAIADAYRNASILATGEIDLPRATFAAECPWPFDQIVAENFWPREGAH